VTLNAPIRSLRSETAFRDARRRSRPAPSTGSSLAQTLFLALFLAACSACPVVAAPKSPAQPPAATKKAEKSTKPKPDNPAEADTAPDYEPQLLRLSEMLGALAYLEDICGHEHNGQLWRSKMAALLDAEAKTAVRKERLAGAFNRGFRGYALTYRLCTPNAQAVINRFLTESGKLAHDVARRYGPN
jgi:uncharacterized protein (TIGR02301 family)